MQLDTTRAIGALAALALAAAVLGAAPAAAQPKSKSVQTEAEWVAFDAAASTVKAKITKPGSGAPKELALKSGEEVSFKVKAEGTILTKTTVAINGKKAELTEIPAGKTVLIYWAADQADPKARFARKIDVIFSEEELNQRYQLE